MGDSNERLREARKRAGYRSAAAAARRFGWTESTYASHENGQTPVPKEEAVIYAKAFKVRGGASFIVYGDNPPNKGQEAKTRLAELVEKMPPVLEDLAADYIEFLIRNQRRQQSK